jgi:hypothetical protein
LDDLSTTDIAQLLSQEIAIARHRKPQMKWSRKGAKLQSFDLLRVPLRKPPRPFAFKNSYD